MTPDIKLVILFGSRASGKAGRKSDTDVAVLADRPFSLEEKSELSEIWAKKLHISEDELDIVDIWNATPLLQHQIAEKGKLLEGSDFDFVRFRVLAWKRYQDTAKFRRARSKALKSYVQRTD